MVEASPEPKPVPWHRRQQCRRRGEHDGLVGNEIMRVRQGKLGSGYEAKYMCVHDMDCRAPIVYNVKEQFDRDPSVADRCCEPDMGIAISLAGTHTASQ